MRPLPYAGATGLKVDADMPAERPDNVIALAPYRMARLARRQPPRPYLMWYPQVGFVPSQPMATATLIRPLHTARAVKPT